MIKEQNEMERPVIAIRLTENGINILIHLAPNYCSRWLDKIPGRDVK
jgi:hypothetical protein